MACIDLTPSAATEDFIILRGSIDPGVQTFNLTPSLGYLIIGVSYQENLSPTVGIPGFKGSRPDGNGGWIIEAQSGSSGQDATWRAHLVEIPE